MPRRDHSEDLASMPAGYGPCERIASGQTRVPLIAWRLRLAGMAIAVIPMLIWSDASRTRPAAPEGLSLVGHTVPVLALAFSPDGRWLASGGIDQTVRLWDKSTWERGRSPSSEVIVNASDLNALAFSPDGSLLATAALGVFRIWSMDSLWSPRLERNGLTIHGLAFSPDGRTLALGAEDGRVWLWDMPECRERAVLRVSSDPVCCLAYSRDGRLLATGGLDGRVVLWEARGGAPLRVLLQGSLKAIRALVFSPDDRTLGVAEPGGAGDALFFDVETGALRSRLPGGTLGIVSLAFSPDGRFVATASIDRTFKLWDASRWTVVDRIDDGHALRALAFSPDGRWLARAGVDGEVMILEMRRPGVKTPSPPPE